MGQRGRHGGWSLGALLALAALVAPLSAEARATQDVPVTQVHSIAQSYLPGVLLPTAFPRSITAVDIGGAGRIGTGPPPAHQLTYHAPPVSAFQLGIWKGARKAAVVAGLIAHDGAHGSTKPFRAGRFAGTLEIQDNVFTKPHSWVASYVWQTGAFTYLVMVQERPGGKAIQAWRRSRRSPRSRPEHASRLEDRRLHVRGFSAVIRPVEVARPPGCKALHQHPPIEGVTQPDPCRFVTRATPTCGRAGGPIQRSTTRAEE
jgi:hypothetical protein